jgi:hypothetical protein
MHKNEKQTSFQKENKQNWIKKRPKKISPNQLELECQTYNPGN